MKKVTTEIPLLCERARLYVKLERITLLHEQEKFIEALLRNLHLDSLLQEHSTNQERFKIILQFEDLDLRSDLFIEVQLDI